MYQRWAAYIDIEGFGAKWNDSTMDAFRGINSLMQGIFWIGDRYFREPPDRLFAYQFGDGFLIASDFPEQQLDRAVLVAIALLRHLLANGETAKCAISEGEVADIQNCYPPEVRSQLQSGNIQVGAGLMVVTPVLGSALINAVRLQKRSPSGPLLTISQEHASRLNSLQSWLDWDSDPVVIDWLRGEPTGLKPLQVAAGFSEHSELERMKQMADYISANTSPNAAWKENAKKYLLSSRA